MLDPTILTSSMMSKVKCESLFLKSIQLVMVKRLKPTTLTTSSSSAECKVMPLILNAATPVGAASNTTISSGSKLPESLSSLRVSE